MKSKVYVLLQTAQRFGVWLLILVLITIGCRKDNATLVLEKTPLSYSSRDLEVRLSSIKEEFYDKKLEMKFLPKDENGITWQVKWNVPKIQTVNDSVSYVFYPLIPLVRKNGKLITARQKGSAKYLMVKNEKEYYEAFFSLPDGNKSKLAEQPAELLMKKFTGKLLLSNLENKLKFLLDYKDGVVSEIYIKSSKPFVAKF